MLLKRVPETLPPEVIKAMGATDAQKAFASVPVAAVDDLADAATGVLAAMIEKSDRDVLLTALIGALPPLVERVLDRLPPLEAQQARRQINHPGPIRLSDVEEARRQIARLAEHEMLHLQKKDEGVSLELGTSH